MPNDNEKKTPMTRDAAERITRNTERTGENRDFAERAREAAERNDRKPTDKR